VDGAFFDFVTTRHVLRNATLPDHWLRFRCGDWGSAKPFAFYWMAVASEPWSSPCGKLIPKGAIITYREFYGIKLDSEGEFIPNTGVKLYAEEVGRQIWDIERQMEGKVSYGVIDPAAHISDGGPSIAERIYKGSGGKLLFRRADNARVAQRGAMGGWDQFRSRLDGVELEIGNQPGVKKPMLYFMDNCVHAIRTVPVMQHDENNPEDLASDSEDHPSDAIRYGIMSRPYNVTMPDSKKPIAGIEAMGMDRLWEMAKDDMDQGFAGRI
jgi:hypothetical protein